MMWRKTTHLVKAEKLQLAADINPGSADIKKFKKEKREKKKNEPRSSKR